MAYQFVYKGTFKPRSSYEDMGSSYTKVGDIYFCGCPKEDSGTSMGEVFGFRPIGDYMKPVMECNHNYMATSTYGHGRNLTSVEYDSTSLYGLGKYLLYMASRRYGIMSSGGAIGISSGIYWNDNRWDFYSGGGAGGVVATMYGKGASDFWPDDISAYRYANKHVQCAASKYGSVNGYVLILDSTGSAFTPTLNATWEVGADSSSGIYAMGYKVKLVNDHCYTSGGNQNPLNPNRVYCMRHNGSNWDTTGFEEIISSDGTDSTSFGVDIEYDTETNTVFISSTDYGVYMFSYDGTTYIEQLKLDPPADSTSGDNWGENIYAHNNFLFVAAPLHKFDTTGGNQIIGAGAVYVYTYDSTSITFYEKLIDLKERTTNRYFGRNDILFDGDILLVGSINGNGGVNNGVTHWWRWEDPNITNISYKTELIIF